jgi:hypothetical protein
VPTIPGRFKSGVSTAAPGELYGNLPIPSPLPVYGYSNDFSTYAAGDWVVTSTGAGASALTDGLAGQITLTTGATTTNYQSMELAKKSFYLTPGYASWFNILFKLGDVAHTLLLAGWVDTLAGPNTPGTGIYFSKTDASTTLNLILNNAGTKTTMTVGTVAADTWYNVGWYYNGKSLPTISAFSSIGSTLPVMSEGFQVYGGHSVIAAGANSNLGTPLTNLPASTVGHTMAFGISTGTNTAHTLIVDHVASFMAVNRF